MVVEAYMQNSVNSFCTFIISVSHSNDVRVRRMHGVFEETLTPVRQNAHFISGEEFFHLELCCYSHNNGYVYGYIYSNHGSVYAIK